MDSAIENAKAIRTAIKQGNDQTAISLISAEPSQLTADTPFGTWLHVAAAYGRLHVVQKLVEMGADIHANGGPENANPVYNASYGGHLEVLNYLLTIGAKPDVREPDRNPLFAAITLGHSDIAKRLIEAGIDVNVTYRGTSGKLKNALSYARDWGRSDIALLIESVAK